MEFYVFSAASHEGVCNSFVFDGEFEDVGFHGVGAFTDPAESRLYESSFVCLENISFIHDLVQVSSLHTFSEYKEESEEDEGHSGDGHCCSDATDYFGSGRHKKCYLTSFYFCSVPLTVLAVSEACTCFGSWGRLVCCSTLLFRSVCFICFRNLHLFLALGVA